MPSTDVHWCLTLATFAKDSTTRMDYIKSVTGWCPELSAPLANAAVITPIVLNPGFMRHYLSKKTLPLDNLFPFCSNYPDAII